MKRQHGLLKATLMLVFAAALSIAPRSEAAPAGPLKLVALGDSLTAGYGLPAQAAFPAVLERLDGSFP